MEREGSLSDKSLAVQQAVMVEASMGHLPDGCKWNLDGSTMICESDGKGGLMFRIVSSTEDDSEEDGINLNPLSSTITKLIT